MEHILFVEDDELIASGLVYAITQEGYRVTHCRDVASATAQMQEHTFSLGLLDLSLPDGTGYTLCQALKARDTPVIFLTAVDDEGNIVQGLEMGADDYVTKPFRLRELLARIRNVLRRQSNPEEQSLVLTVAPDLQIHTLQGRVTRGEQEIDLTVLEYRLLLTLARHKGQVLSRAQLLEGIWDVAGSFVNDNTLSVYIKRLREKLGDSGQNPQIIQTVRGVGYRLDG